MPDATGLRPDGPHSPAYTRDVGNVLAEAVRVMNYATLAEAPGLEYPSDADRLLRDVLTALDRLPQLLGQVRVWLDGQASAGAVGHDQGQDASRSVAITGGALISASGHLATAADVLRRACEETSHLTGKGDDDG
jgi:hypothetical protein